MEKKKELPNKIWLDTKSVYFGKPTDKRVTEYIRTDVVIENACEYLMEYEFNDSPTIADRMKRVETFKMYMKGV